jgi:uncharacterized protein (TIGR03067 family)
MYAILVAACLHGAGDDPASKQMAQLQGEWTMVSGEIDGQALPAEFVKTGKRTATGDEVTIVIGGRVFFKAKFSVDPTQTPKTIDYAMTEGPTKGKKQLGIYELKGDTVKFCFGAPGGERPKEFTTTPGSGRTLSVWQRAAQGGPSAQAPRQEAAFTKKTYIYRTAGATQIAADVYRAEDTKVRPVVVWLHGGALIVGSRTSVPKNLLELCRTEGYALVSLDYRLAPEVKLPEILSDVEAAFGWLRHEGPKLFHIDPERVVVTGGSAGGYLTLVTGFRVTPRPTALVAYWGYGDVDGEWYTRPSEHYRMQPLVPKEEAEAAVGKGVLTGTEGAAGKARGRYYLYLRQNGLWTKTVTGIEPGPDRRPFDAFCPVRNVSPAFPPTLLVHGTVDTDVPYELSAALAKEFSRHGVPHELVTVEGAGHGLSGGDPQRVGAAHTKALEFIRTHLQDKK